MVYLVCILDFVFTVRPSLEAVTGQTSYAFERFLSSMLCSSKNSRVVKVEKPVENYRKCEENIYPIEDIKKT